MPPMLNALSEPADVPLADATVRRRWDAWPPARLLLAAAAALAVLAAGAWMLASKPGQASVPMAEAEAAARSAAPNSANELNAANALNSPSAPSSLAAEDPAAARPLFVAAGDDPEGRLVQAYAALAAGEGRKALEITEQLLQAHPGFHLAQLLHGDLLAARSGLPPRAFAGQVDEQGRSARADIEDLRAQALRRMAALRERPPAGHLPREMIDLPPHVKHAVAVDTERSRLYLFRNGPGGLALERDFYVSLGKQGIGKRVEGDARTPLGVYWITNALPSNMLDERFGRAALGINYPNALDRHLGRTGTGLFLHGVPAQVYSHNLWATDGCVALANDDVELLLKRLEVADTPVVIARQLQWVAPGSTQQAAEAFRPALQSWDEARRAGDAAGLARWYENEQALPAASKTASAPRAQVSLMAWYGDAQPMMIVTSREPAARGPAIVHRQYWAQVEGQWRIRFDGPVPPLRNPTYARR